MQDRGSSSIRAENHFCMLRTVGKPIYGKRVNSNRCVIPPLYRSFDLRHKHELGSNRRTAYPIDEPILKALVT